MNKLTEKQKDFILDHFFKSDVYTGWRNIGTKLIDNGECIVAGNGSIWVGGIGNFISLEVAEDFIECTKLEFDLKNFLNSRLFMEIRDEYILNLSEKLNELKKEYREMIIFYGL